MKTAAAILSLSLLILPGLAGATPDTLDWDGRVELPASEYLRDRAATERVAGKGKMTADSADRGVREPCSCQRSADPTAEKTKAAPSVDVAR